METPKKEIKKYNFEIKNKSPMERKRKALEMIEAKTDCKRGEAKSSAKKIAKVLCISPSEAEQTVKELANEGLVQIGNYRKCMARNSGRIHSYERALSITPQADLSAYVSTSVGEKNAEKCETPAPEKKEEASTPEDMSEAPVPEEKPEVAAPDEKMEVEIPPEEKNEDVGKLIL